MELRINEIRLLSTDLFDGMVRHLCLNINNEELTEETVSQLHGLFESNPGEKELKFRIRDSRLKANVQLVSSDWRIDPTAELIRELQELGVGYSLV